MDMRLLDLFCGAGGAATGYYRAGFTEIWGVDIKPQKNYPFTFCQQDAVTYLKEVIRKGIPFHAIHASPPCQKFVPLSKNNPNPAHTEYIDELTPTLHILSELSIPWVVENVMTAPMPVTVILCGSSFGLKVRRHRKFASNVLIPSLPCRHKEQGRPVGVYGGGFKKESREWLGGKRAETKAEAEEAMGIDWMNSKELCEAIPPAYTEYIGEHILNHIKSLR